MIFTKRTLHIIAFILLLSTTIISATQAEHLFNRANNFYKKEAYDSAAFYYEEALNQGCVNSSLYYNTGNSYFRLGKIGKAILNFERGYRLKPNDPDIKANLLFARKNIIDEIQKTDQGVFVKFMNYLHNLIPLKSKLIISITLLFLISLGYTITLFLQGNRKLWILYLTLLTTIMFFGFGLSSAIKINSLENNHSAIILKKSADAQNAPDGTKTLFTIHEGTKVKVIKHIGKWYFVSLANGVSGWIKSETFEII